MNPTDTIAMMPSKTTSWLLFSRCVPPALLVLLFLGGCLTTKTVSRPDSDAYVDAGVNMDSTLADGSSDAGPCGGCSGATPVCNTVTTSCVACLASSDCAGSAPVCDTSSNTCVQCLADLDCSAISATPVCDEPSQTCVECTADTEAQECGTKSCRLSDFTCTSTDRASLGTCDSCEADSECSNGKCVVHTFGTTPLGPYCFAEQATAGCGDTNMSMRPYRNPTILTSIDGQSSTYCMPPTSTTCQGISDTQNVACTVDTDCGETGLADGYCPSGGSGAGFCTYLCGGGLDCSSVLSCGDSPLHCRP